MALSWSEIRDRAVYFSREWSQQAAERAGAQTFWSEFFEVFGISRRRVAAFEAPVKQRRDGGQTATGFIDLFWKGQLLVAFSFRCHWALTSLPPGEPEKPKRRARKRVVS